MGFSYKDVYRQGNRRILDIDILPERYCNFDCTFCPIPRTKNKTDDSLAFDGIEQDLVALDRKLAEEPVDLVFINPAGEALVHRDIERILHLIHGRGVAIRLLSNGYLFDDDRYRHIVNRCDEVISELKTLKEEDFQRLQRPLPGYTLEEHISRMTRFNAQYEGTFILEITLLRGVSDSEEALSTIDRLLRRIRPDRIDVVTPGAPFDRKFGVPADRLPELAARFQAILDQES
jgi:wyosine [tRNA(Phe)-imidazoG37] synthetase (radical SAM superfamily)